MLKSPATPNAISTARIASLLAILLIFSCGLFVTSAQQQSNQQQRPRRVGSDAPQKTDGKTKASSTPTPEGLEVDEGDVVRVDTQLVSVPAVVTDRTGHPLINLRPENFVLYEDGRPQQISNFATTEAPFEVVLLLDTSCSTRDELGLIRRAAIAFIDQLRPGDRVAIVAFNSSADGAAGGLATVDIRSRLTSDRDALQKALEDIGSSNGTPYYDALTKIAADIFSSPPKDEVRGRRAVVALTDGVDSASHADFAEPRARLPRA